MSAPDASVCSAERHAALEAVAELSAKVLKGVDDWNESVRIIVGRQPNYTWGDLEGLRAALARLEATR